MSEEKPLHVRVAEALGWSAWQSKHGHWIVDDPAGVRHEDGFSFPAAKYDSETGRRLPPRQWWDEVDSPRYDTDWSATGPLIERYGISLALHHRPPTEWVAFVNTIGLAWGEDCFGLDGYADDFEYGPTPLVAVCNLILSLKAAGKLEPAA